jgi:hypothetical protein
MALRAGSIRPNAINLRRIPSDCAICDRGIVPCLAKETAVCAVDHLPLSVKMRCPEEGGERMLSDACDRFSYQLAGVKRTSKSGKHKQLVQQAVFFDFFFDVFDDLSQVHLLREDR